MNSKMELKVAFLFEIWKSEYIVRKEKIFQHQKFVDIFKSKVFYGSSFLGVEAWDVETFEE